MPDQAKGMSTRVGGIHHITQCPGPAQQDVDFCTQVLGQRLVKQTVLMDGSIPIYHFYYGNADAEPGSITTSFPYSRKPGRRGSGQISRLSYAVPRATMAFWRDHLERYSVEHSGIEERFGRKCLRMWHPAGMQYELVEAEDTRRPWTTEYISADIASRGFFGAVMSVRSVEDQELFLIDALGFRKVGVDGPFHRFEAAGGGPGSVIDLHHEPDLAPGSWGFGSGTFHHIAFTVENDVALVAQKAHYEELGYTDASEVKDRYYFHSMYVRSPGGILVECTANVPGGFYQDESAEELGTRLTLPPWYESQRGEILAMLERVTLPDENQRGRTLRPLVGSTPVGVSSTIALSRSNPDFARYQR